MHKMAFVAFFQGEQLKSRIKKVCSGFHASLYPCPNSHVERMDMLKGVRTRLEDLNLVRHFYFCNEIVEFYPKSTEELVNSYAQKKKKKKRRY